MMTFCIRDDDTNFFTTPEQLENAYSSFWRYGPISLAVVPFQKGCMTKGIPEQYRNTGEIYPLEENQELVAYLRQQQREGRIEIMLHGYHHEHYQGQPEFCLAPGLSTKVRNGKAYLERLLESKIRVFVPPHNTLSRVGLRAVVGADLHLGSLPGLRLAWPLASWSSWRNWWLIRSWRQRTGLSYPWVVDLKSHREIAGHSVTPISNISRLHQELVQAVKYHGVFCLATHYWEFDHPHSISGHPSVREQISSLVKAVLQVPKIQWVPLGDTLSSG